MQILFYLTLLLLLAYSALIIYYAIAWKNIPEEHLFKPATKPLPVTVIIPARNEENNIRICLASLKKQTYPAQIIVINDHSTDNTASVVTNFPSPGILLLNLQDHLEEKNANSYKKRAIELGIKHATGDLIICTDADCISGPDWISGLVQYQQKMQSQFIAAPVKIADGKGLLSIFQALDFLPLQGITAAAVSRKIHSMSNGANLCYTKKAFINVNGFEGIDQIASGDDMLLMHKIALAYPSNINYLKSKDAIVITQPEKNLKAFMHQRIRWASKAGKYKDVSITIALLLVYLANILCGIYIVAALINPRWLLHLFCLLALKTLIEFFFVRSVARFFGQAHLMIYFPFIQPLHIFYTILAGWLGVFGTYQWKNRTVR